MYAGMTGGWLQFDNYCQGLSTNKPKDRYPHGRILHYPLGNGCDILGCRHRLDFPVAKLLGYAAQADARSPD